VELERIAEKPTVEEVVRRIQSRGGPRDLSPSPTEMIREERSRRWS
jgi:hypothetical protein